MLPAEVDVLITEHLLLLGDLGGFQANTANATEIELRSFALADFRVSWSPGVVSVRQVNIMSRFIIGEDVFPTGDECFELADLEFQVEADDLLPDE